MKRELRDGDTIEVEGTPVRIANLDCAEMDMPDGPETRRAMEELVAGETFECRLEGRRSYDREVGPCALATSGEYLGEEMIGAGACERWRG